MTEPVLAGPADRRRWRAATGTAAWLLALVALSSAAPMTSAACAASVGTPPPPARFDTVHRGTFGGTRLRYRASVEEYRLDDAAGAAAASVFVTSYTGLDLPTKTARPVIFAFNGGPGSSSLWLHLGVLGPRRIEQDDPTTPRTAAPFRTVANPDSPLDVADVVLIDPPGTGYSRLLPGGRAEQFLGVEADARAVVEVMRQWLRRHGRENAPKYLISESYGTVRGAVAARLLAGGPTATGRMDGVTLNGVILAGQAMDMTHRSADDDDRYLQMLPTLAVTACYFGKVAADCTAAGQAAAARRFIATTYLGALYAGSRLSVADRAAVATQLAALIGVTVPEVLARDLRISGADFARLLLAGEQRRLGIYDARYTLPAAPDGGDPVADDPAMGQYVPSFVAAWSDYARGGLGVTLDQPYEAIAFREVNARWDYGHGPGVPIGRNFAVDLAVAMARNPQMRVMFACGYYDLATPFGAAEYVAAHAGMPLAATTFRYYASGHMPYLGEASRAAFAADIRDFIRGQ